MRVSEEKYAKMTLEEIYAQKLWDGEGKYTYAWADQDQVYVLDGMGKASQTTEVLLPVVSEDECARMTEEEFYAHERCSGTGEHTYADMCHHPKYRCVLDSMGRAHRASSRAIVPLSAAEYAKMTLEEFYDHECGGGTGEHTYAEWADHDPKYCRIVDCEVCNKELEDVLGAHLGDHYDKARKITDSHSVQNVDVEYRWERPASEEYAEMFFKEFYKQQRLNEEGELDYAMAPQSLLVGYSLNNNGCLAQLKRRYHLASFSLSRRMRKAFSKIRKLAERRLRSEEPNPQRVYFVPCSAEIV